MQLEVFFYKLKEFCFAQSGLFKTWVRKPILPTGIFMLKYGGKAFYQKWEQLATGHSSPEWKLSPF